MRPLIVGLALGVAFLVAAGSVSGQAAAPPAEEFVGPFASWAQVQCGGQDDTDLLQKALDTLGQAGASPVLYVNARTCRISNTLKLGPVGGKGKQTLTFIGADPATTRIVWAGPAGGTMFAINGVGHSRYGRITWDGGGSAAAVYKLSAMDGTNQYFSTSNRHEDEVFTNLAPSGVAVRAGDSGIGDAETEWFRCHFIGPMAAGILLKNFNVGDYWVWDSEFQNVGYGVTNLLQGTENGAGWYAVNRSNFLNSSTADMAIGNTGFFSSRWNYSRGSRQHVLSYPIGSAASPWSAQGETVVSSGDAPPYTFGSVGPLGLLDSVLVGGPPDASVQVHEGYSVMPGGDLWAIGNKFTSDRSAQYSTGGAASQGRMHGPVDDTYGAAVSDPGPPGLPETPPASTAPVIEVQNGDIAAALAQAGSSHAIVHIPYGVYQVPATLQVGPQVILTGDGYGVTQLRSAGADPILHLSGPSQAVIRDLSLYGWSEAAQSRSATGIVIDNADQPGGLVHSEEWIGERNDVGWNVANLGSTVVDLLDHLGSTNSGTYQKGADPSVDFRVTNARMHIFNGAGSASDVMYEVHSGELVSQTMYYESRIPTTFVMPGSSGTLVLDGGKIGGNPGKLDTSDFNGTFTLLNTGTAQNVHNRFGSNSLVLGYQFGWGDSDRTSPTFSGGPFGFWEPRHNNGKGGTDLADEVSAGVPDENQYLRDHLAALRTSIPVMLGDAPTDATYVRLYRVGGELLKNGVRVVGDAN
jgi:hypothetical protein